MRIIVLLYQAGKELLVVVEGFLQVLVQQPPLLGHKSET
jgi:hypothetical protein